MLGTPVGLLLLHWPHLLHLSHGHSPPASWLLCCSLNTPGTLQPQDLCTFVSLCLEQSSPRYSHSLLLPLFQVFVQILPSQWYFPCPSYLKVQSPTLPIHFPSVFFSKLISLKGTIQLPIYSPHWNEVPWGPRLLSVLFTAVSPVPRTVPGIERALK